MPASLNPLDKNGIKLIIKLLIIIKMKAKHLFFAMVLPGLFAACTQEEWAGNEADNSMELGKRHNAGLVELSVDGAETRFNHELGKFNNGEEIDLYLMDELTGACDNGDANHMHGFDSSVRCWKYFNVWNELYALKNYTQTRYPFAFDETSGTWKNDATLLEGNYFAMHPGNEKITNRRDVWHYINPVQSFSKDGEFYKLAMDNQFWLGYTPVYRDEDRTGEMTLPLSMQPVMTVLKLNIGNTSNKDVIIDKIVFKANNGQALPTIAYVRPATQEDWRKTAEVENPKTADGCGDLKCNGQVLNSEYSKDLTWPGTTVGRATARGIVEYATPAEHIPYGLEDTNVAYEYVFKFDEASENGGHFLKGGVSNGEYVTVFFPLPHNLEGITLEPVIYGRVYDKPSNSWKYGIVKKGGFMTNDNKVFTLDQANLGKLQPYAQEVTVECDTYGFEALTEARIESTEDLMRYVKGLETSYTSQENVTINAKVYGNGLTINDEVIEYLKKVDDENDCFITLDFEAMDNSSATVILDTEKESMKYFNFGNGTIDFVVAKGNHSLEKADQNLKSLTIEEGVTFNVKRACTIGDVVNNGTLNVAAKVSGSVENHNIAELQKNAEITGTFTNENVANVTGSAKVNNLVNDNTCVNCGNDEAVLTIAENGDLTVQTLTNDNKIVNNGKLTVEESCTNTGVIESNATSNITALTNQDHINVNAGTTTLFGTTNSNKNTITVAADAQLLAEDDNVLSNQETGEIHVYGDLVENIKNSGVIYVVENGHVGVNGVVENKANGIIDLSSANNEASANAAFDKVTGKFGNYFRYTVKETEGPALRVNVKALISENNYDKNPIILVWNSKSPATFGNTSATGNITVDYMVERVIIERELTLNQSVLFEDLNNNCKAVGMNGENSFNKTFEITKEGKVIVSNDKTLTLTETATGNYNNINAWIDGLLKVNNRGALAGDVKVFGAGTCEFYSTQDKWNTWKHAEGEGAFTGKWENRSNY